MNLWSEDNNKSKPSQTFNIRKCQNWKLFSSYVRSVAVGLVSRQLYKVRNCIQNWKPLLWSLVTPHTRHTQHHPLLFNLDKYKQLGDAFYLFARPGPVCLSDSEEVKHDTMFICEIPPGDSSPVVSETVKCDVRCWATFLSILLYYWGWRWGLCRTPDSQLSLRLSL